MKVLYVHIYGLQLKQYLEGKLWNDENKSFKDSTQEANKECWCKSRETGREEITQVRIEISELENQNKKRNKQN